MENKKEETLFEEHVVSINRVTKVVKGGRRFRFSVLVVIGDKNGNVGFGTGKAVEIPEAIKKAVESAKKRMILVPVINNSTIPHEGMGVYGAGQVFLRPAAPGTGVIAGGAVRAVLELAGINDILSKSIGSNSPINMVRATFNALSNLMTKEDVMRLRGVSR